MGGTIKRMIQPSSFYLKYPQGWRLLVPEYLQATAGADACVDSVSSKAAVLLLPFTTASVHPFSFSFRSTRDVRNALALKFRPLLSGEESVEIVPFFSGNTRGATEGVALCVWEREIPEETTGLFLEDNIVWPLPLALASAVNGEGVTVFRNDTLCASAVFRNGLPAFLRCRASHPGDKGTDEDVRMCMQYAVEIGMTITPDSVWVSSKEHDLLLAAKETVKKFPRFLEFNVSRPAIASSLSRERTALLLVKMALCTLLAGLLFCGIQFYETRRLGSSVENYSAESATLFRETFGASERVVDPLSQARRALADLRGQGETENSFSQTLAHLGRTWLDGEDKRKNLPVLEQLRYTGDGADITGTAESVESIQLLRENAGSGGYRAALGDIQQIPGGGLRFTLSLRRESQ